MMSIERLLLDAAGSSMHPLVSEASTHLVKAGGKRVRPMLVMLTSRAGQPGREATSLAAAAIELVHLASLYHDDVMDQTATRRGVPTVHARWGVEVAVLSGDYLFARGCALGARAGGEVPGILARAIAEVCEGQIAETETVGDPHRSVRHYLDTIAGKTGALFRAACELGAATSGAKPSDRSALVVFGQSIGLAFQIVDDLLDVVGDPAVTGKVPGTDIKEGVYTLPVLMACERAPQLAELLLSGETDLDSILPQLISTGALYDSYRIAEESCDRALAATERLPGGDWRGGLRSITDGILAQVPDRAA